MSDYLPSQAVTIHGIKVHTDEAGLVIWSEDGFDLQYQYDAVFAAHFERVGDAFYLLSSGVGFCDCGMHLVGDDELVPVMIEPATHSSPAEYGAICGSCAEVES